MQALIIYSCLPKWTTLFTLIWNLYFLWRYIELVLILAWQTLGYWWLALSGERLPVRVTLTLASWGEATGTTATSGSREQEQTHPKLKYVRSQICVTPLTNEMCLIKKRWFLYFWRTSTLKEGTYVCAFPHSDSRKRSKALSEKQFVCMAVNSKCGINSPGNTRHHYRGNWL